MQDPNGDLIIMICPDALLQANSAIKKIKIRIAQFYTMIIESPLSECLAGYLNG